MNKRILLGIFITIAVLIGISFTSVLGYQNIKSSTFKTSSPLFNLRSSRVIGKENEYFTCDYVGKGDDFEISFPLREKKEILIKNLCNMLQKIDDEKFERFIDYVNIINKNNGRFDNINLNEIKQKDFSLGNNNNSLLKLFTMYCGATSLILLGLDCLTFAIAMIWIAISAFLITLPYGIISTLFKIAEAIFTEFQGWLEEQGLSYMFSMC